VADCAASVAAEGFRDVGTIRSPTGPVFTRAREHSRTVLRMLQRPARCMPAATWMEERLAQHVRAVNFPSPVGRVRSSEFPGAEIITIPHHLTDARGAHVHEPAAGSRRTSFPLPAPILQALLRSPLSRVFNGIIGTDGHGRPDEATRAHDEFHIAIDVRGCAPRGACHRRLLAHGHDPYGLEPRRAGRAWCRVVVWRQLRPQRGVGTSRSVRSAGSAGTRATVSV